MSVSTVEEYYNRIDQSDIAWVISRFSPDAVYERAEVSYRGLGEISRFFCEERLIRGVHRIDRLVTSREDDLVVATGRFTGTGPQGDPKDVGFADVWHFDTKGLVRKRQTFLALGNAYVRE